MNVYTGIHSYPWLVHGDPMRDLLARGVRAGIEYEQNRVVVTDAGSRDPGQIADAVMDNLSNNLSTSDDLQLIRGALEDAAREAQTPPDFRSEGEHDEYRDAFESIEGETLHRIKVEGHYRDGLTSVPFTVSRSQIRRILAGLSAEGDQ